MDIVRDRRMAIKHTVAIDLSIPTGQFSCKAWPAVASSPFFWRASKAWGKPCWRVDDKVYQECRYLDQRKSSRLLLSSLVSRFSLLLMFLLAHACTRIRCAISVKFCTISLLDTTVQPGDNDEWLLKWGLVSTCSVECSRKSGTYNSCLRVMRKTSEGR